jgi:hypothetical protein
MYLSLLTLVLVADLEPPQTGLNCTHTVADVDPEMTVTIVDVASSKQHRELRTAKSTGSIRLGNTDQIATFAVRISETQLELGCGVPPKLESLAKLVLRSAPPAQLFLRLGRKCDLRVPKFVSLIASRFDDDGLASTRNWARLWA